MRTVRVYDCTTSMGNLLLVCNRVSKKGSYSNNNYTMPILAQATQ